MTLSKLRLEELDRVSPETFAEMRKNPIILVADNIRSGHNIGAMFRSADAFAIEKIHICGISPRPPHKEINKTAIGATKTVNWEHFSRTEDSLATLRKEGYEIIGVEQTDNSTLLQNFKYEGNKVAIVMGNEVEGIGDDLMPLLDRAIEIEQFGTKHSINVSVCTGIVLWALIGQLRHQ
ncbi:MAG: TrmH family RNA methyltransferase [Saprospiraceae bacterium]|nr:TrmH family RNA methyltransferase [Saprospiraceae bacterium]